MIPKVSVIIPVYNAEKYIDRCARTLFSQTLEDMEFIFVDDCTPDKSFEVLESVLNEFPERKPQVKIIHHLRNCGVSQTRQDGLEAATGEYTIHCDPDDWVELDMYEQMYKKAKEIDADIIGCNYWEENANTTIEIQQDVVIDRKEILIAILNGSLHSSVWSRLVKRTFILDNNIFFKAGISFSEDADFTVPLHMATEKFGWIPKPLYHYRMSPSSITHNIGESQILSYIKVIKSHGKYYSDDDRVKIAHGRAMARALQPLITVPKIYNPPMWLDETKNMPYSYFGSLLHRISPWLIRHGFFRLNLFIINIFRCIKK